jgi:fumarate reductase subunit D
MRTRFGTRGNHAHASWWAFFVHRVSGLLLALFLPLHFWALAQALHGAGALDTFLRAVDRPLFKLAEWGLVLLLALHAAGGVRLLLIEFGRWSGLRKDLVAAAAGFGVLASLAFALALFY